MTKSPVLPSDVQAAIMALKQGKLIAYPTAGVYGLGCDPFNASAVNTLLQLKQRPVGKGLILVASQWEQVQHLVLPLPEQQKKRAQKTWPGPVTWLFPASSQVPDWVRGEYSTIALRVSAHPIVRELCEHFSGPIVSTSANISGSPCISSMHALRQKFANKVAVYVAGSLGGLLAATPIFDVQTGLQVRQ